MRELPGFYYDPDKKKYFRLIDGQRRHDGSRVYHSEAPATNTSSRATADISCSTANQVGSSCPSTILHKETSLKAPAARPTMSSYVTRSQLIGSKTCAWNAADQVMAVQLDRLQSFRWQRRRSLLQKICAFPRHNILFGLYANPFESAYAVCVSRVDDSFRCCSSFSHRNDSELQLLSRSRVQGQNDHYDLECVYRENAHKFVTFTMSSLNDSPMSDRQTVSKLSMNEATLTDDSSSISDNGRSVSRHFPGVSVCVQTSNDRDLVAVAQTDAVCLFDCADDQLEMIRKFDFTSKRHYVRCMTMMRDGTLVLGTVQGQIGVIDYRESNSTTNRWRTLTGSKIAPITSVIDCESSTAQQIVFSALQHRLGLMDLRMPNTVLTWFEGHRNSNSRVRASVCTDRRVLVCPGDDGPIRFWSLTTGRLLNQLSRSQLQVVTDETMNPLQCVLSNGWRDNTGRPDRLGLLIVDRQGLLMATPTPPLL
jgi:hypothetical protein